jgi:glucose-6-phosphate 1-dehydrogenase
MPNPTNQFQTRSDALVIFGISGDLAKKMTFISLYHLAKRGLLDIPVIGVAFSDWSDEDLRNHARQSVEASGTKIDESVWATFSAKLSYIKGDYTKAETYSAVKDALGSATTPLFYLEIPPGLFLGTVQGLHGAGLLGNARVVIEKPFGHDYDSAVALYGDLAKILHDDQIYRIDHYLGKNAIQDIMVWRFANSMFEPMWNNAHIESVQITMAESFDVSDRGSFYDKVGALKDVVQNHIMQIIGLLSMDPPSTADPAAIHAQQLHAFESMRPIEPENYVRGQYDGYLDVEGVEKDSETETFVALKIFIDSWRWSGVPFFVRAGKSLGCTATEAVVVYKRLPLQLFNGESCEEPERNRLRFRLGHDDGVQMQVQALDPGAKMSSKPVVLNVDFSDALGEEKLPYEQLLGDALEGNATRFATQKIIEGTWQALASILKNPGKVHVYETGTMGPEMANSMTKDYGGWIPPV